MSGRQLLADMTMMSVENGSRNGSSREKVHERSGKGPPVSKDGCLE